MRLINTNISGAYILDSPLIRDYRGAFCKIYNYDLMPNHLKFTPRETYYNISNKNVIRGMHFQVPPYDHSKLIKCVRGEILDVILDIRKESSTYLKYDVISLNENDNKSIFLPKGIAHGFLSKKKNTIVLYHVSSVYNPNCDKGILWNSFGFDWPTNNPILSNRDQNLEHINEFKSPF